MSVQMSRGLYNNKNNLKEQVSLINEILPHFGITNLADYDTQIGTYTNINIPELNKVNFKERFKVSGWPNPIETKSQAITVLKNTFMQAGIPFYYEKTDRGYTFSVCKQNMYLNQFVRDLTPFRSLESEIEESYILDYNANKKSLSEFNFQFEQIENCVRDRCNIKNLMEYPNILNEVTNSNDSLVNFSEYTVTEMVKKNKNVRGLVYDFPKEYINYKLKGKYYRGVYLLGRWADILFNLKVVFDKEERRFGLVNSIYQTPNLHAELKNCDIPLISLPYNQFFLVIPITKEEAEENIPIKFYVQLDVGSLLPTNRRKFTNCVYDFMLNDDKTYLVQNENMVDLYSASVRKYHDYIGTNFTDLLFYLPGSTKRKVVMSEKILLNDSVLVDEIIVDIFQCYYIGDLSSVKNKPLCVTISSVNIV